MKAFFLLLFSIGVASCGAQVNHKVSGEADIVVATPKVKQVNGVIYIKFLVTCIAIDTSSLYPDTFRSLEKFDDNRITKYSYEEVQECLK